MAYGRSSCVEVVSSSNNAPQLRLSFLSEDSSFSSIFDDDTFELATIGRNDFPPTANFDEDYSDDSDAPTALLTPKSENRNRARGRYRNAGQSKFQRTWGAAHAAKGKLDASCQRRDERRQEKKRIRREKNRRRGLGRRRTRHARTGAYPPIPPLAGFHLYRATDTPSRSRASSFSFTTIASSTYSSTTTINEPVYSQHNPLPRSRRPPNRRARVKRFRKTIKSAFKTYCSTTFINHVLLQFARSGGGLVF
ncbi:hypothetical protein CPC08DRAFT_819034 [Agrocybe pediades]|nr:hypothetical protein CPC08DRAFT_819034 [Agrocybe pediades]